MVEQGEVLLGRAVDLARRTREEIAGIEGLRLMGEEIVAEGYAREIDPLVLAVDVRELGITGYQAAEWARAERHVDFGAADSCRFMARLTHADAEDTAELLLSTLRDLVKASADLEHPAPVDFPSPEALQPETVMVPRDAFFGPTEDVSLDRAAGRIAAELVSPYPPGVPVLAPGERIEQEALDYLRSGLGHGMLLPDPADPQLGTVRVVAR